MIYASHGVRVSGAVLFRVDNADTKPFTEFVLVVTQTIFSAPMELLHPHILRDKAFANMWLFMGMFLFLYYLVSVC